MKEHYHAQKLMSFSAHLEAMRPTAIRASLELNLFLSDTREGRIWAFLQEFQRYESLLAKYSASEDGEDLKRLIGQFHTTNYKLNSLGERS